MSIYDVIIIGGGPAGLRLAHRLAEADYKAVLFDDRPEIGKHKICTGIISPEAFQRFELPRSPILNEIQRLKFFSPRGTKLEYRHPSVLAHVVDRTAFDKSLAERAQLQGAEIRVGKRVHKVTPGKDWMQVEAQSVTAADGNDCLRSRLVAVATGVNFKLNKALGLGVPNDFLNAAQAHIKVQNLDCTLCYVGRRIAPGAFAWAVPLADSLCRVGLMAEGRDADYFNKLLERIAHYHNSHLETVEVDFKPIAQAFSGKTCSDRVITVGEAAGHVKTTTGGGIYYGLLCADLAADVIIEALRQHRFGEEFLSRYEESWQREISRELDLGCRFRKAFSTLSDRRIERLFTLARMNGLIPMIRVTAQFDWHADVLRSVLRYKVIRRALGIDLETFE